MPPVDQWNLLISGGFQAPTGAEPPPLEREKNLSPPWTNSWIRPWASYAAIFILSTENTGFRTTENRIYREEFTRKKCKTAILLYCFHTADVLHIFMLYNLLGTGISFYRKSKIIIRKPNYEIGWFHNWTMIISHRLYAFHFTNDDFPL